MKTNFVLIGVCQPSSNLAEDFGVTSASVIEPGCVNKIHSKVRRDLVGVNIDDRCTYYALVQFSEEIQTLPVNAHDIMSCPIVADLSVHFDINELFPEPVIPIKAIKASFGLEKLAMQ